MRRRWILAAAVAALLGAGTPLLAQVPRGGASTFGRNTSPGIPQPFLNNHGYSGTLDPGRPQNFLNGHGYNSGVDFGRPIPNSSGNHAYGQPTPTPSLPNPRPTLPPTTPNPLPINQRPRFSAFASLNSGPLYPNPWMYPGSYLAPIPGQIVSPPLSGLSGVQPTLPAIYPVTAGGFLSPGLAR